MEKFINNSVIKGVVSKMDFSFLIDAIRDEIIFRLTADELLPSFLTHTFNTIFVPKGDVVLAASRCDHGVMLFLKDGSKQLNVDYLLGD